jgi:aspartate/methionine/tyrosine aminotransferase
MSEFQPFELERIQSGWEHKVKYNLTESGVHPIRAVDLLPDAHEQKEFLETVLHYPEVNGTPLLRQRIAALYPQASEKNVLVTVGCIEANYISLTTLMQPGDEAVVMVPNYLQIWGMVHNLHLVRREFHLVEEKDWAPDLDELEANVNERTKLIAVCNPNNPTGRILTENEMDRIIAIADKVGAWILADETYRGAERLRDKMSATFWGKYDQVLATSTLSKAYGLPGLRIGWVICPENQYEQLWMRHEYMTITAGLLDMFLAEKVLEPGMRAKTNLRAREYIRQGFPRLQGWMDSHPGLFTLVPPQASAVAFVKYNLDINSTVLAQRLIDEKSVFIVPGDNFGIDHHFRISFGLPEKILRPALSRIDDLLNNL